MNRFNDLDIYHTGLYPNHNYVIYIKVVLDRHGWTDRGVK